MSGQQSEAVSTAESQKNSRLRGEQLSIGEQSGKQSKQSMMMDHSARFWPSQDCSNGGQWSLAKEESHPVGHCLSLCTNLAFNLGSPSRVKLEQESSIVKLISNGSATVCV